MDRSRVRSQWITPRWVNHLCGTQKIKDAPRPGESIWGDIHGSQMIIFGVITISVLRFLTLKKSSTLENFRLFFFFSNFDMMVLFQFWLLEHVPDTQKMPFLTLSWMHVFVNVFWDWQYERKRCQAGTIETNMTYTTVLVVVRHKKEQQSSKSIETRNHHATPPVPPWKRKNRCRPTRTSTTATVIL